VYIEFILAESQLLSLSPASFAFQSPETLHGYITRLLVQELDGWSDQYNIPCRKKIHKGTLRVTLDYDKNYSFFAMTWNHTDKKVNDIMPKYHFIEPMNVL